MVDAVPAAECAVTVCCHYDSSSLCLFCGRMSWSGPRSLSTYISLSISYSVSGHKGEHTYIYIDIYTKVGLSKHSGWPIKNLPLY